jgi:hypothetical protein
LWKLRGVDEPEIGILAAFAGGISHKTKGPVTRRNSSQIRPFQSIFSEKWKVGLTSKSIRDTLDWKVSFT